MKNFIKIKKKFIVNALLCAVVIGVGVGAFAAATPIAVCKLLELMEIATVDLPLLWCIAGGAGLGALTFGVLLLCLYPFPKRLARRLDKEMGMGEKVQTMLEFSESEDDMAQLQRNDTERRLSETPKTVFRFKPVWQCIVTAALAISMVGAAIIVPVQADEGDGDNSSTGPTAPVETPFEVTNFQLTALRQLIEHVQESEMQTVPKATSVNALELLYADISDVEYRKDMVALVGGTMQTVDNAVEAVNTGFELATALEGVEHLQVKKLSRAIGSVELERFTVFYADTAEAFKDFTTANETISSFSVALTTGLAAAGVPSDDALYLAIQALHAKVVELIPNIQYYTETSWPVRVDSLFGDNSAAISAALAVQIENDRERDYIIRKLKEIFALLDVEMPQLSRDFVSGLEGDGEEDKDEEEGGDGGLGDGDYNFPSDELVLDPDTGEQVRYGELLAKYYNRYLAALQEGKIDPNLEKLLQSYFDLLSKTEKAS
jgi:hypothetical protein